MDTIAIISFLIAVVLSYCARRVINWLWVKPRRLEKFLRQQGLEGNSYRFWVGDINENAEMIKRAKSQAIKLSDDVIPRVIPFVYQTVQRYGQNSFIWYGPTARLQIADPDLVKQVLNNNTTFKKLKQPPMVNMFAHGLASIEGQQWSQHRRLLTPVFYKEKLRLMCSVMYISCKEIIEKWEEKALENNGWCELDVAPYISTLTSDVISRTAFGSSYEEGKKVFELQHQQITFVMKALQSIYIPGWRFLPTKNNRRMKELNTEIQSTLNNIIDKKNCEKNAGKKSGDLLGILLQCISNEKMEHGPKHVAMSNDDVIGECKLFYFAGQETTSNLLAWTMILLSIHPSWQTLAREEVFHVFGDTGMHPNLDNLNSLKVVTMILYEVLRLYPPAHTITRKVHQDTKLGNLNLPVGVEVQLSVLMVHYDPEIWGEDVKEFKPERFAEGVSKATRNSQGSYFPFGLGLRNCIGQHFAIQEAKLALATILQNFSFQLSPSYVHAPASAIILQPQHGARLIIHKI